MHITLKNTKAMDRLLQKLDAVEAKTSMQELGVIAVKYIKPLVPKKTGALREAYNIIARKGDVIVTWNRNKGKSLPYTHYQYEGVTYETNYPVYAKSGSGKNAKYSHVGWTSSKMGKTPTERHLGTKFSFVKHFKNGTSTVVKVNGYTVKGTGAKWLETARNTPTVYYPMRKEMSDYIRKQVKGR